MADTDQTISSGTSNYEAELKAANEKVYKHSLELAVLVHGIGL